MINQLHLEGRPRRPPERLRRTYRNAYELPGGTTDP